MMDINQIPGTHQALSVHNMQAPSRQEAPQAPAAAPPVLPNNGVRVNAPEASKPVAVSDAELKRSLEAINKFLQPTNGAIEFSVDEDSNRTIVKIVDTKTQTVLRQIPSKEALEIAKDLDKLQGLLVRDKA